VTALPKVYVTPFGRRSSTDVEGGLVTEAGDVLWTHASSLPGSPNEGRSAPGGGWLRADLTTTFSGRRNRLAELYPDGYEVVEVEHWRQLPAHLVAVLDARAGDVSP
jgi:hypothetical protein